MCGGLLGCGAGAAPPLGSGTQTDLACMDEIDVKDMDTVDVADGTFEMGCTPGVPECDADESPVRKVTITGFTLDKTEVSKRQYYECVHDKQCFDPTCDWNEGVHVQACEGPDTAVTCVTWNDAQNYCKWAGKRLPTEAEWEYAARGTDGRAFPWGNDAPTCDLTNMDGCGGMVANVGTHPKGASPFGALDMAGNVVEYVNDWLAPYDPSQTVDPQGPAEGKWRSGRGGGWHSKTHFLRATDRDNYLNEGDALTALGFRCVSD